ncbi:DUF2971 domain-containing protein [Vibrio splendidus]|uniref:DUF2971 domain-containing protein n=1 Tax=Vibrio splendidus TaxID=29497 RepID=UPI0000670DE1|nr:DUF2971 domain-containing protein [Vibrio splendidus]EAP93465.1 hypothetical protein V12B01_24089 [Vibrio splendidus 12B01]
MGRIGRKLKMKLVRRLLNDKGNVGSSLPPLYKYLGVEGARLTLANQTFKFAKPSDFNDLEDLTVRSVFEGVLEGELSNIWSFFPDVLLNNLNRQVTCSSPMKEQVIELQSILKGAPLCLNELKNTQPEKTDVAASIRVAEDVLEDLNHSMQDYRVFCVTTELNSEYMWQRYAEDFKGIALRIEPSVEKDSKFQLFKPVTYRKCRPVLYSNAQIFIENALFGNSEIIYEKISDIIHTKTLEWQWEYEYRLAVPLVGEQPWNTLLFHPEEITELHLGPAIEPEFRESIIELARSINPEIALFQVERNPNGTFSSEPL